MAMAPSRPSPRIERVHCANSCLTSQPSSSSAHLHAPRLFPANATADALGANKCKCPPRRARASIAQEVKKPEPPPWLLHSPLHRSRRTAPKPEQNTHSFRRLARRHAGTQAGHAATLEAHVDGHRQTALLTRPSREHAGRSECFKESTAVELFFF